MEGRPRHRLSWPLAVAATAGEKGEEKEEEEDEADKVELPLGEGIASNHPLEAHDTVRIVQSRARGPTGAGRDVDACLADAQTYGNGQNVASSPDNDHPWRGAIASPPETHPSSASGFSWNREGGVEENAERRARTRTS